MFGLKQAMPTPTPIETFFLRPEGRPGFMECQVTSINSEQEEVHCGAVLKVADVGEKVKGNNKLHSIY